MKFHSALFLGAGFAATIASLALGNTIDQASQLELEGCFQQAAGILRTAMTDDSLSQGERRKLAFELDRLGRIKRDYPYTQAGLFRELQKAVKDLTLPEFEKWLAEGRFDVREIDGERRFMNASVSNLFFRHPELNARRLPPKDTTKHDRAVWETCVAIQQAALAEQTPYVLPKRFRHTMTVTVKAGAASNGEIIRAWLPIPRRYPFQTDFRLRNTSSLARHIDDEFSPIRSVYLEQPAQADQPTEFRIEYQYTMRGIWFQVKPDAVMPANTNDPALQPYLREAPHVVFTPEMRALSDQIAGGEKNPARLAQKFHNWIAENIKYSYALEYSTIRNIGDYCRAKGYGDCGQEALLFITLCRMNNIPARWQSGWNTFPGAKTIHDWCEIYLAPYGWIPVDNYKGIWAMQYAFTLTPEQKREVRDFYFGGLDYYRMAANSDHNQALTPPKRSFRSDDVDFQRGELEWGDQNIYFDQYSYRLEIEEITAPLD
ncbi:MAG: transglutaminase domain-containing protein [Verrucomicrobiae bacterium]|nr:transglutaminase domain-containing protein [Verrucomicrobiae bacterium]